MGDQRQPNSIPGTLAASGIPLQHWILLFQFWRELLKRLLSLDAEHSELQVRQGIPASPPVAAWVTKASVCASAMYQLFYPHSTSS